VSVRELEHRIVLVVGYPPIAQQPRLSSGERLRSGTGWKGDDLARVVLQPRESAAPDGDWAMFSSVIRDSRVWEVLAKDPSSRVLQTAAESMGMILARG
jgi:hypothetical protein